MIQSLLGFRNYIAINGKVIDLAYKLGNNHPLFF